jgi:hypothetical protein
VRGSSSVRATECCRMSASPGHPSSVREVRGIGCHGSGSSSLCVVKRSYVSHLLGRVNASTLGSVRPLPHRRIAAFALHRWGDFPSYLGTRRRPDRYAGSPCRTAPTPQRLRLEQQAAQLTAATTDELPDRLPTPNGRSRATGGIQRGQSEALQQGLRPASPRHQRGVAAVRPGPTLFPWNRTPARR